ncbi:MAG: replication factor C small subunit [DPANN group archaeon]|nr:replication factor C small subunit [DPANN group archaeon]
MIDIWTEKYRPDKLDDVVGQKNITDKLKAFAKNKTLPHCLFAGTAGIGKTTSAIALAKDLYGDRWKSNLMETNASDERGIDVVRNKIKDFAKTKPLGADFKIIFLDESDALTPQAQQALRRTMEKYTNSTRFILSCNYSSKIIPPIQSRCAVFRFGKINNKDISDRLKYICDEEGVKVTDDGMDALLDISEGDLRKAVNILQSASITTKIIDKDTIYAMAAMLKPEEVKEIVKKALENDFLGARKQLMDVMISRGLSGIDVIKAIHREILILDVDAMEKARLIDLLGEYEFRIVEGGSEDIQIEAFLANLALTNIKK